jgi:excinuclease ABC subunit B
MDETERRREIQLAYNEKHGITPETVQKGVRSGLEQVLSARKVAAEAVQQSAEQLERGEAIAQLQAAMLAAAEELDFERAARLRDRIQEIETQPANVSQDRAAPVRKRKDHPSRDCKGAEEERTEPRL